MPGQGASHDATFTAGQEHSARISKALKLALRLHVPAPYLEHLR
ncbi:hypothetical protein ACTHQX_11025 [Arthrobacter sp. SAFR-023]